jgi:hypothetical protein
MVLHRVAVVGNVTSLRALNVKIRQVFEEELALEARAYGTRNPADYKRY